MGGSKCVYGETDSGTGPGSEQRENYQSSIVRAATRACTHRLGAHPIPFLSSSPSSPVQGLEALFTAMCPCARLYAYLGCQLASQHAPTWKQSPYSKWVGTYSGSEFTVRG